MTPELISALASIGTFIVIAVTAVAAIIQLRHIRSSNQLSGVMEYIKIWETEQVQRANVYIHDELPAKLRDSAYRRELFALDVDRTRHPELVPCDWCEQAGSYIKYGLIAEAQFLDLAGGYVERIWPALKEVVAIRRAALGTSEMYENFEYLVSVSQQRHSRYGPGNYPRKFPRLLSDEEAAQMAGPIPTRESS